jgi:hypothetical protein
MEIGTVMIGTTLKDKKSIILPAREFVNENRKRAIPNTKKKIKTMQKTYIIIWRRILNSTGKKFRLTYTANLHLSYIIKNCCIRI